MKPCKYCKHMPYKMQMIFCNICCKDMSFFLPRSFIGKLMYRLGVR